VAFSALAWWPAFTLGAWGQIFFEQILALWAAATAAFVVLVFTDRRSAVSPWRLVSLLVPTAWIALAALSQSGIRGPSEAIVGVLGTLLTLAGLPLMAALLVRIAAPEVEEDLTSRDRRVIIVAVVVVVAGAYLLGRGQTAFLTCDDFSISGNSPPAGCAPGASTLEP
jgi:hypothetical protein